VKSIVRSSRRAATRDCFESLLRAAGQAIFQANPLECPSAEDGYEAAEKNLGYYCGYYQEDVAEEVRALLSFPGPVFLKDVPTIRY
jgi:hypothetical protein